MIFIQKVIKYLFFLQLELGFQNRWFFLMLVSEQYFPMTGVIEIIKSLSNIEQQSWESTSNILFIFLES